jgi:hypothetical protein
MDAVNYLEGHPLELSDTEVTTLDRAVHLKYIGETATMFGPERFDEAPRQTQAVAVSLHYQFGILVRPGSPALHLAWDAMREGKYGSAADYLTAPQGWSKDHQQYLPRRRQEAALLKEIA